MKKQLLKKIGAFALMLAASEGASAQQYVTQEWDVLGFNLGQFTYVATEISPQGSLLSVSNDSNGSNSDIVLKSMDADGSLQWEVTCTSSSTVDDYGTDLKIDASGDIYVCGATYNGANYDYLVAKFDNSGNQIWEYTFNGSGNGDDIPTRLVLDANNDVFVTGSTFGDTTTYSDFGTLKIDGSNGDLIWSQTYDYNNLPDAATDIALVGQNVVVCGGSASSQINSDFALVKYKQSNGDQLATGRHDSPGNGLDLAVQMTADNSGNVYLIGTSNYNLTDRDAKIIAFNSSLQTSWVTYFDKEGAEDEGYGIAVSEPGKLATTGLLTDANGNRFMFVSSIKMTDGSVEWQNEEEGDGRTIEIGDNGTIYVGGQSNNNMTAAAYQPDGNHLWTKSFDSQANSANTRQISTKDDAVYVTGISQENSGQEVTTVKYTIREKTFDPVYVNGIPSHMNNQVVVKFYRSSLNMSKVDDLNADAGLVPDFIQTDIVNKMKQKTGIDWRRQQIFKVHPRANSADSLSVSRLGDTIQLPDFWATFTIEIPEGFDEKTVCDSLLTLSSNIEFASRNSLGYLFGNPNDTYYFGNQYGLYPNDSYPHADINARDAWDIETGEEYIRVGVYDNLVDWSRPDFGDGTMAGSKVVDGRGYTYQTFDGAPGLVYHHGTQVAGIIGALRNNGIGIAGVAGGDMTPDPVTGQTNRGALLLSFGIVQFGQPITAPNGVIAYDDIAQAILEGALQTTNGYGYGLNIQNHSWGFEDTQGTPLFREDIKLTWKHHCIIVAARGNSGNLGNPNAYPACFDDEKIINVVASGNDGNRATLSNGGDDFESSYGNDGANNTPYCSVDIMAPGTTALTASTLSTYGPASNFTNCTLDNNEYRCFEGTSAAAPHVSGTAALMLSQHHPNKGYPNMLATEDVEQIMEKTATHIVPDTYDIYTGHGRLNAFEAVSKVSDPYYVKHQVHTYGDGQLTLLNVQTGVNSIGGTEPYGFPNFTIFDTVKTYKLKWDFVDQLPPGHNIIDDWEFNANTIKGRNIYSGSFYVGPEFLQKDIFNIDSMTGTVTGSVYTYVYRVVDNGLAKWIPAPPDQLKYSYSLHVLKQPDAGIEDLDLQLFSLYPNPSDQKINLKLTTSVLPDAKLLITDASGRIVMEKNVNEISASNSDVQIDISALQQGVYYVTLASTSGKQTRSFIKLKQ